ncbi:DUF4139 domain-containing protein [Occallatibacter savannae]|uniref:DUF4139 domain-containing protein n=1 Tax=Occallatibacter savannae TaxID=1002691 RepID=UPI000D68E804|nr:DUF4139 domain-containing protein [Occallatibacter savannae]
MRLAPQALRLACILIAPAAALLGAETADAPAPLPKTVAVAAFKNGLAFVLRQGEIPVTAGTARLSPIPTATLGTLWIAPVNPEARIDEIVAYRYNTTSQRPIQTIGKILRANAGKTVTITYQMKDYTGEVVGLQPTPTDPAPNPIAPTDARYPQPQPHEDYLLLRTDKRLMAFPLGGISMATLPDDATLRENIQTPTQALRLKLKSSSSREKISMGYLEHGLGWTPSYLVSLTDDTNAQITMQAVVSDDAEDLQNAQLFFVVGVPNFAYSNTISPMSLQQSLVDFMKDAERDYDRKKSFGALSNAISAQAMMADEREAAPINLVNGVDEMSSAPEEDLFLYSRSDVTLAKGERATYNVFSGSVGYQHLYNWEVEDQPRVDPYGNVINQGQNMPDNTHADSIWHSIRLKNSTKFPWTSAPALVISGDKPVSQDTLAYTQKSATSTLRITVATDLRASHEEREVARQQELNHRRGYNYDLVTVEGRLKVKNYKSKEVHLAIGKTLRGKSEFQSDEGKTVQLGEGIESDNPKSRLTWEITLAPGQERIVTYRYRIWVRA